MESSGQNKRSSGIYLKTSAASLRVAMEQLDELDRRLSAVAAEARKVDEEVGFVLLCLRLELLTSASELALAAAKEPFAVPVAEALGLIDSYKVAIADATVALADARARKRAAA